MVQKFTATILQHKDIDGAYVEPPFDVEEVFGAKRVKVKATFDGLEYRGSVVRMGGIYMLGLTKDIRTKIGKNFGDCVEVTIEKDEEERVAQMPPDFAEAVESNPEAKKTFETLSFSSQKDYVLWITGAKKEDTRKSRIDKAIILLSEDKKLR